MTLVAHPDTQVHDLMAVTLPELDLWIERVVVSTRVRRVLSESSFHGCRFAKTRLYFQFGPQIGRGGGVLLL